jgi:hypothetical protein
MMASLAAHFPAKLCATFQIGEVASTRARNISYSKEVRIFRAKRLSFGMSIEDSVDFMIETMRETLQMSMPTRKGEFKKRIGMMKWKVLVTFLASYVSYIGDFEQNSPLEYFLASSYARIK